MGPGATFARAIDTRFVSFGRGVDFSRMCGESVFLTVAFVLKVLAQNLFDDGDRDTLDVRRAGEA